MRKIYLLLLCVPLLFLLQSCYIKERPNMSFLTSSSLGSEAEIVSLKVPMFLVKTFVAKERNKDDDETLQLLIKKIKGVKVMTLNNARSNEGIRQDFRNFLEKERMEEYASIFSDGDRISINGFMKKDKVTKLMLGISSDDGEHVFVEIKGNFTMDEIGQAVNSYERK